jgi:hypothetical protein
MPGAVPSAASTAAMSRSLEAPQVTARPSKADLVEYAVAQGMDHSDAKKLTAKEMQERYVRQQ